jgi:hypothetical protein
MNARHKESQHDDDDSDPYAQRQRGALHQRVERREHHDEHGDFPERLSDERGNQRSTRSSAGH